MIEYRTCRRLSLWTTIFLAVLSLTILVSFFVTLSEIQTLDRMEAGEVVSEEDRSEIADRQARINFLSLIANVAAIIAFLMWIYRASKNLKHLHVDGQRFSPLRAVLWWFVPIFWFFRPYQVMKEIWKGSFPGLGTWNTASWMEAPVSPLLGWWWGLWLLGQWMGILGSLTYEVGETVEEIIAGNWFILVSDILLILASALAMLLVWQITSNQEQKHADYTQGRWRDLVR